ncbi:hypothetical protein J6590_033346 [Homalodisca vitripennis]|nr:hypothetical protein J6590_033346 [Homalodisca vitripennis]
MVAVSVLRDGGRRSTPPAARVAPYYEMAEEGLRHQQREWGVSSDTVYEMLLGYFISGRIFSGGCCQLT